ncbi:maleate cis-trans isomerase family protein [Sanguibacter sp. Z1732]|uniref:maleate cis-trans isomerase family protein n=1 Tax=Sanguibacter sp. Z1732 TaxID=3435412 RepID=UPI003D9C9379
MELVQDQPVAALTPLDQRGVGVIAPYDFALDRELWEWIPPQVSSLHLTRTPYQRVQVNLTQAELIGAPEVIARCAQDLHTINPEVMAYACTSGSFVGGLAGEAGIVSALRGGGFDHAVTTSGALLQALAVLDAQVVAVATPYDEPIAARLAAFLHQAGIAVSGLHSLGLSGRIWTVPYQRTADLIRRAARASPTLGRPPQAVVVSCTNLPTRPLIAPLEAELGIPVITANQATIWAALRTIGLSAVGPGQHLLTHQPTTPAVPSWPATPAVSAPIRAEVRND